MGIGRLFNRLKPKDKETQDQLDALKNLVSKQRFKLIQDLLADEKVVLEKFTLSSSIAEGVDFPQVKALTDEVDPEDVNEDIKKKVMKDIFQDFSKRAYEVIQTYIAPNIKGMETVKKAVVLQLFSEQPIHILLLGDPGTGKTDILRSSFQLSPISSFGLGSGTSGVGLVATVKGNKVMKGLLPLADKGICCIDELNLMKEESRAGLYNAMEKGFVTYDKGGLHHRYNARAKILATANPKGDAFSGNDIETLRKELPFDSALLTRFHLLFLIRKPDLKKFKAIAEKITSQKHTEVNQADIAIIQSYIAYTHTLLVDDIDKKLQEKIVEFVTELKKKEKDSLVEVSPRQIIGIMRLCKAFARMEVRDKATISDFEKVKAIFLDSLEMQ